MKKLLVLVALLVPVLLTGCTDPINPDQYAQGVKKTIGDARAGVITPHEADSALADLKKGLAMWKADQAKITNLEKHYTAK